MNPLKMQEFSGPGFQGDIIGRMGRFVGKPVPRLDARDKLQGTARFVADLKVPGMLYGAVYRSPVAHARILEIYLDPSFDWQDVVVVTARDVPGENRNPMILKDQPFLAEDRVKYIGEPIALLAHEDPNKLKEAMRHIQVKFEPLPAVYTIEEALQPNAPQVYPPSNLFVKYEIRRGNPEAVFRQPGVRVVEAEYRTGFQEHVYLETQGMLALYRPGDDIKIVGSMQCPFYVLNALRALTGGREVEVEQATTGGGFGGKEEYPSLLAAYAYLLALKARRPVRIVYDRQEDMAYTTKRHASLVRHRTALDSRGRILAMEVEVYLNAGAYATLSPVVLARGILHATGVYEVPEVAIRGYAVATNLPPSGAFRGFGAPQTLFALERHMDFLARQVGEDPVEFRRRHLLRNGKAFPTGEVMQQAERVQAVFQRALDLSRFQERKRTLEQWNRQHPHRRRGIGLALFLHGSGFTGSGEKKLASRVRLELLPNGEVWIRIGSVDMGQGTLTVLSQIVAEATGAPLEKVRYAVPNTRYNEDSGPTVASRTVMVVGGLLEQAGFRIRQKLEGSLGRPFQKPEDYLEAVERFFASHPEALSVTEAFRLPPGVEWDEERFQGKAYLDYAWACYVAEVEVDLQTYRVRPLRFVAVQDVGTVVNPLLAEGQVHGGVAQGLGWALLERLDVKDGRFVQQRLAEYIVPTALDMPEEVQVAFLFQEGDRPRGLGELPMDGSAPALINAVVHALGTEIFEIPATPDRLWAWHQKRRAHAD